MISAVGSETNKPLAKLSGSGPASGEATRRDIFVPQLEMNWPEEPRTFAAYTKHCPVHGVMPYLKRTWDEKAKRALFKVNCSFLACDYTQEEWSLSAKKARRLWNLQIVLAHDP